MARKPRDYKAEYARRNAIARDRGFTSYAEQRRRIERGETRAIAPSRLRNARTIRVQDEIYGIFGSKPRKQSSFEKWASSLDIRAMRMEHAQRWSDWYSQHWSTQFDADRARTDDVYLNNYTQTLILQPRSDQNLHHFDGSDDDKHWFVDVMGYMTAEEFDAKYHDK